MKENSPIIASQVEEHIDGPMEAPMKEKSRMDFATGMASTATTATTVTEFKKLVQQKTQVPADKQRLVFSGKQLVDGSTIGEYGMFSLIQSRNLE